METETFLYTGTLERVSCWCGIRFAIPEELYRHYRDKQHVIWCPLGHQTMRRKNEADILRDKLAAEESKHAQTRSALSESRAQAAHHWRSANTYRGKLKGIKRRVANGVCPCCKRTFQDLAQHMHQVHPEFEATEA